MIELKNIGIKRDDWIFQGINLHIEAGDIIGIIGRSGIGKTTLLEVVSGLLDSTEGEVLFKGAPIIGPSQKLIPGYEDIQIVNQDFKLEPYHTVEENIKEKVLHLHKDQQIELTEELLDLVELTPLSTRKAKMLSGGEQQRLSIARALACEPEILLLDEPFVHLDQRLRFKILNYILELNEKRCMTVVIVSHDGSELMGFTRQMLHLDKSGVVRKTSTKEMYYLPETIEQAELMGPINYSAIDKVLFRPNEYEIVSNNEKGIKVVYRHSIDNGVVIYNYFNGPEAEDIMLTSSSVLENVSKIKIKKRA